MRLASNSGNPSASVSQMLDLTPPRPAPFPLRSISFFLSPNLMSAESPQSIQFLFWPCLMFFFFFSDFLSKVINHSKIQWEQYMVPTKWGKHRLFPPLKEHSILLKISPLRHCFSKSTWKWLTAETLLAVQRSYLGKNIAVTMNISSGVCDTC